jgi:hypothetical protein
MALLRTTIIAAIAFHGASAACAADLNVEPFVSPSPADLPRLASDFFEIRAGGFKHQPFGPKHALEGKNSWSITGEVVLPTLFRAAGTSFFDTMFAPRIHAGAMVSAEGLTSYGYAGLTWTFDLTPQWFTEVSFGAGYSDGDTTGRHHERINVGCRLGFHETVSLGYRITDNWSVMATFAHLSNAALCPPNDGVNELGVRASYRF